MKSPVASISVFPTVGGAFGEGLAATGDGRLYLLPVDAGSGGEPQFLGEFSGLAGVAALGVAPRTAVVGLADGELVKLWIETGHVHRESLARLDGMVDIGALAVPGSDDEGVVVVALADGAVHELRLNDTRVVDRRDLGPMAAARVAVVGNSSGGPRVLVAGRDGSLFVLRLDQGATRESLPHVGRAEDVAGFVSDDGSQHAVVVTAEGGLVEITGRVRHSPLRSPQGLVRAAAAFDPATQRGRLLLATRSGALHTLGWTDPVSVSSVPLGHLDPSQPWLDDVSPDPPTGVDVSSAGVTLAVAGDLSQLYAVSFNAGVWGSNHGQGWYQLPAAPHFAYCIAVDPADVNHVVVGERPGDAPDLTVGTAVLWESIDGGSYWQQIALQPPAGCSVSAITSVFFSQASTLYIGTACGAGRRRAGDGSVTFTTTIGNLRRKPGDTTPLGVPGAITAFSESATAAGTSRIWARTATKLLFSDDDGSTWTVVDVPPVIDGHPSTGTDDRQGDLFSLAAFGDSACYFFRDPVSAGKDQKSRLIFYNDLAATPFTVQVLPTGDGTGAGGKRTIKSYLTGGHTKIFFSAAQDLWQGTIQADATVTWNQPPLGRSRPAGGNDFHADMWDFNVASDGHMWVATDGGVFRRNPGGPAWVAQNDGLHTQHIQSVTALPATATEDNVVYATHDNGAWSHTARTAGWQPFGGLGDVTFTVGDTAVPSMALAVRHREAAAVTTFGAAPPAGADLKHSPASGDYPALNYYKRTPNDPAPMENSFGGTSGEPPITLQIVQTLAGEPPQPLLDLVMLADLPLTRWNPVTNTNEPFHPDQALGQPNPGGNPVLIRAQRWAASPWAEDGFDQKFWKLEDGNLPHGTFGFWVTGGHGAPTYYACADQNGLRLFRRARFVSGWVPVTTFGGNLLPGGQYGPVFANPYNPQHLYVLTDQGVQVSTDGAATFQTEVALTELVTNAVAWPIDINDVFTGGTFAPGLQVQPGPYLSISSGCLAHMAFLRSNPAEVVAVAPFAGVFYNSGDVSGKSWQDLTYLLPDPLPRISSVAVTDNSIYLATSGRGLLRIANYRGAGPLGVSITEGTDECGLTNGSFSAETTNIPIGSTVQYAWSASGGTIKGADNYAFVHVSLDGSGQPLIVKVTVTAAGYRVSTSKRWVPLDPIIAERLSELCAIMRDVLYNPYVDPLWDPVRDLIIRPIEQRDPAAIRTTARAIDLIGNALQNIAEAMGALRTP